MTTQKRTEGQYIHSKEAVTQNVEKKGKKAVAKRGESIAEIELSTTPTSIYEQYTLVMYALDSGYKAMMDLSVQRADNKMSNTRVVRAARELKELIKVMSVYASI